jgi:hypothetical protein
MPALVLVLTFLFAPVAGAPPEVGGMDAEVLTEATVESVQKLLWDVYPFNVGVDKPFGYDYPARYQDENGNLRPKPSDDYFMHPGEMSVGALVALLTVAAQRGLLSEPFSFFDLGCSRGHTCLVVLLVCLNCVFSSGIELAEHRIAEGNAAIELIRCRFPRSYARLRDKVRLETGNFFVMMKERMAELRRVNVMLWADLVFKESRGRIWENIIDNMDGLKVLIVNQPWSGISDRFKMIYRGKHDVSYSTKPAEFVVYEVLPRSIERLIKNPPRRASTSNLIGHLEEMSETCQAHAAALDDVRENSKGYCLTAAGEYVQKCTEGVFLRDEH